MFDKEVYIASEQGSKEAAALGGALLGKWVWWKRMRGNDTAHDLSFETMRKEDSSKVTEQILVATPNTENARIYEALVKAYKNAEDWVVSQSN